MSTNALPSMMTWRKEEKVNQTLMGARSISPSELLHSAVSPQSLVVILFLSRLKVSNLITPGYKVDDRFTPELKVRNPFTPKTGLLLVYCI